MTTLTDDMKSELLSLIKGAYEDDSDIIEDHFEPRPLATTPCTLTLATDGLMDEVTLGSNLLAMLCLNLHMADEWGWGLTEILISLRDHDNRIEQNGLTWLPETFQFLNSEFATMTPDIDWNNVKSSTLYQEMTHYFARSVFYHTYAQRPDWLTLEVIEQFIEESVIKLIHQLENGRTTPDDKA